MISVGYLQFNPEFMNIDYNLEKAGKIIESYKKNIDILVLPELFATGYFFPDRSLLETVAEEPTGRTYQFLSKIAKKRDMAIYFGFPEKSYNKIYNSAMIIKPDGSFYVYRKNHLFYKEKKLFDTANSPIEPVTVNIRGMDIRLGLMICFDWFFPEVARTLALKGSDIILHAANLVMPYCPAATITRALENRVFIVLADRIGEEKVGDEVLKFIGMSRIVSPKGKILKYSTDREEIKSVYIDINEARDKSLNLLNNIFTDRREDLYFK
ncbi:MAG TPA: nitrilase-related carbon-nitrogen hydrolase [Spirochaetota bacterium]|nr:nitrilase-related carbon-nitrogen hydrolase [Spirochaetota bacterium]HOM38776.1 nitrilase-related carbon-nitrogen hydrolase [Spirochaetota bacterium]HPQ49574.1 nitrilase-related carbon-nitrogen hydrolase [Spirochaetota bacterium]